jgi:hypothetical protein
MSTGWRGLAFALGAILAFCGVFLWFNGGGPVLLIVGAIAILTALLEPIYGRANGKPDGKGWRPTDEKFVDPETGKLVTVWFDSSSGERRYVEENEAVPR